MSFPLCETSPGCYVVSRTVGTPYGLHNCMQVGAEIRINSTCYPDGYMYCVTGSQATLKSLFKGNQAKPRCSFDQPVSVLTGAAAGGPAFRFSWTHAGLALLGLTAVMGLA